MLEQKAELTLLRPLDATLIVRLSGEWKLGRQLQQSEKFRREIESAGTVSRITFDTQAMTGWDSGLITFLMRIIEIGSEMHIPVEKDGLPAGVDCPAHVARDMAIGPLEAHGPPQVVIRKRQPEGGDTEPVEHPAKAQMASGVGIPLRQDDNGTARSGGGPSRRASG